MITDFNDLIEKISASSTIEGSFLLFLDNSIEELNSIYLDSDNHDLRDFINQLKKYRIPLSTAMASNISGE